MECHACVPQEDKIKEASSWQQEENQTDAKKGGVFLIHDDSLESLILAALHLVFQGHAEQTFGNREILTFPGLKYVLLRTMAIPLKTYITCSEHKLGPSSITYHRSRTT